ncbi:hypothetical protein FJZ31_31680 [Candidatus Poribacteria bacterium]|nr:hypothetical protein [Candidatus Poribacteria bacterium]
MNLDAADRISKQVKDSFPADQFTSSGPTTAKFLYIQTITLMDKLSLFLWGQLRQHLWLRKPRDLSVLKSLAHLPLVAPMLLAPLRDSLGLLATLMEVAYEIMTLGRRDNRKSRLSTAETLRAIVPSKVEVTGAPHFTLSPFPFSI